MKKLLLLPAIFAAVNVIALVIGGWVYIFANIDLFPSENGNRWLMLAIMSLFSAPLAAGALVFRDEID